MRTLILEDDDALLQVYCACVADAGHEVMTCQSIDEAMSVLRTTNVDLMIVDLVIGESNSLGVVQYASYAAPAADIILITGSGMFPNGEVSRTCPGISWVLRKPVKLSDLGSFVAFAERRVSDRKNAIAAIN